MSPDDYDRLYAEARDETPFSNSSQGYGWMHNWCDRCLHDKPAREGKDGQGCPLVLVALMGRTPAQWLCETERQAIYADYHCIEFRSEDDGPGPEPRPIPTPPGQLDLLPRQPYEGRRMLTPLEPSAEPHFIEGRRLARPHAHSPRRDMITFALPALGLLGFGLALFAWHWPVPTGTGQLPYSEAESAS